MKHKKRILILTAVCLIALCGIIFCYFKLKSAPKKKIIKAITNTCASLTAVVGTPSDQFIGMDKINAVLKEQSAQIHGDFSIEFINKMLKQDDLYGFSFAFDGKRDLSNQEASYELSFGDQSPLTFSSYLNHELLALSSPQLSDDNYHINFTKINESFEDSFLGDYVDLPEINIQPFMAPDHSVFSKVFHSFLRNQEEDFHNLLADMKIEKKGKKKTISTLNGTKKCTTYEITLPEESIENFYVSFQNYLDSNTAKELDLNEEAYQELQKDMKNISTLLDEHLKDDIIFSVSLDHKGILREFSFTYKECTMNTFFLGVKNNTDAVSGELQIHHKTHPVTLTYDESVSIENDIDIYETETTLFFTKEPEKKITLTTESAFSKETLEFNHSSKLVIPDVGVNAEVSYDGIFTDYVKNESFCAKIKDLKIKIFGIRMFSLKGELSVSPLKESIESIEPGIDLFTLSKESFEELFQNLKNLTIK